MDLRRIGWTFLVAGLSSAPAWAQTVQPVQQSPVTPQIEPKPADAKPAGAKPAEAIDGPKLPVSLDRIRDGLRRESALKFDFFDPSLPVFRTSVEQTPLKLSDYWKIGPDTAVADYVRPFFASQLHYDFIRMTARENVATDPFGAFGNPLQPIGPPILPIIGGIKKGLSNMKRGRIKRQIQEELKEIEANQAESTQNPAVATPPAKAPAQPPVPR
jgi:hypothetical protein